MLRIFANGLKLAFAFAFYGILFWISSLITNENVFIVVILYVSLVFAISILYFLRSRVGELYRFIAPFVLLPIGFAIDDDWLRLANSIIFFGAVIYLVFFFSEKDRAKGAS